MPRIYTVDELDPWILTWHPDGFVWSPGPAGGVFAWPKHDDELGGEPDLERDDVMIRRVDTFPFGGWMHFAECECEDCIGAIHCAGCGAAIDDRERWPLAVDETGKTWERIPFSDGDCGFDGERTCHDCGARPGEVHLDGCDSERCPKCGGQMMMCLVGGSDCQWPNLRYRYVNETPGGEVAR